jgi:hypothetical protein
MIDHQSVLRRVHERITNHAADLLDQGPRGAEDTVKRERPEARTIHALQKLVLMNPYRRRVCSFGIGRLAPLPWPAGIMREGLLETD